MTGARETEEWVICEDTGRHADGGECPVHTGDACLIVVGWVDNSHVRRELANVLSKLWLSTKALEDVARNLGDPEQQERLAGIVRVTLENTER